MQPFAFAKVVVLNELGELLALQRDPNDFNRPGQWDIPGGEVEAGEDLIQAACRETFEEAGLSFSNSELQLVYGTSAVNPKGSITWVFFVARVSGRPAAVLSSEHTDYAWLTVPAFLERCEYDLHKQMLAYLLANRLLEQPSAAQ